MLKDSVSGLYLGFSIATFNSYSLISLDEDVRDLTWTPGITKSILSTNLFLIIISSYILFGKVNKCIKN